MSSTSDPKPATQPERSLVSPHDSAATGRGGSSSDHPGKLAGQVVDALQLFGQWEARASSGEDFFQVAARHLAKALEMDYVCIDELEEGLLAARTVAVYSDGQFEDNVSYTLKDTPCGEVAGKTVCCFPKGVRHLFPKDVVLQQMSAESYLGTTLWSTSGQPIGLIALISRRPLANSETATSLLQVVGLRVAAELERRLGEKALRLSQERLQLAQQASHFGVFERDLASGKAVWTPELEALYGLAPGSFKGSTADWQAMVHPEDRRAVAAEFQRGITDRSGFQMEYRVVRPDGSIHWLAARGKIVCDDQGQPVRAVGVTMDITAAKAREKELRLSEEFNRSIIDSSSDCIKLLDLQGRLRFMSEGGQKLLGIKDISPYLGMLYSGFWSDEDKPKVEAAMSLALAGQNSNFTASLPTADGRARWWDVQVSPVRGPDGLAEKLLVVSRDVTAQHQANQETVWLASFPQMSPNPVVEFEPGSGGIRYMNPAAQRLLPDLPAGGLAHPWLAGLASFSGCPEEGSVNSTISREVSYRGRAYRQEISLVPGTKSMRIYGIDVTQLRQAQRQLEERQGRLNTLIAASQEMLSATAVEGLLKLAAEAARRLTGARMAVSGHGFLGGKVALGVAIGTGADSSGPGNVAFQLERGGVFEELLAHKPSIRYSDAELRNHPKWWGLPTGHVPLRGLLGVRLIGVDGKPCGVIMASDKDQGDFTVEDEALLAQLGLTASLALHHLEAREQTQGRAEELAAVLNAMPDPVVIRDSNGLVKFANPAARDFFGAAATSPGSRLVVALRGDRGIPLRPGELPCRRALRGESIRGQRYLHTNPAGDWFSLLVSASAVTVGNDVQGSVSVFHDVSDREALVRQLAVAQEQLEKRVEERTAALRKAVHALEEENKQRSAAEKMLAESELRYRTLVEAAPVGISVTTEAGEVVAANGSLCRMLGVDPARMAERKVTEFYISSLDPRRLRRRLRAEGTVPNWPTLLRRADGSVFDAMLHATRIRLGKKDVLLTIAEDVTEKKRTERHLEGVRRLLELFMSKPSHREYLRAVVRFIQEWSGCNCVGLRIPDDKGRLPFAAHVGFSRAFVEQERLLSLDDPDCPCLRVLADRMRPGDELCVSANASFLAGELPRDLANLCVAVRERAALNCRKAGYQTMAHAGVRYNNRLIGTIHLADSRAGRIPAHTLRFVESVAPLIGEALHRFQVEEALMESEERFRALFEKHDAVMLLVSPQQGALVDANPAACRFYSRTREQLVGSLISELGLALPEALVAPGRRGRAKRIEPFETRLELAPEDVRSVSVHGSMVSVRGRALLFLIVQDVTDRKRLQKRILEIGEEERQRVGQDLHDSVGGQLTGIALLGKALAQRLRGRKIPEADLANEIVLGLNEAVVQTRSIAHGLCPVEQSKFGLLSSLHEYAGDLRRRTGVRCDVLVSGGSPRLDPTVGPQLFHILQEAVTNSLRHAKARHIRISLVSSPSQVALAIWNDGKGLPQGAELRRGLGLRTMQYRADMIGARFEIKGAAGGGTVVRCVLPTNHKPNGKKQPVSGS